MKNKPNFKLGNLAQLLWYKKIMKKLVTFGHFGRKKQSQFQNQKAEHGRQNFQNEHDRNIFQEFSKNCNKNDMLSRLLM